MQHKLISFVLQIASAFLLAMALLPACAWASTDSVLYDFNGGSAGGYPNSGLAADAAGNLYGTAQLGGTSSGCGVFGVYSCGVVFELSPNGSGWTYSVVYAFTGGADGATPYSTPAIDSRGSLYVTTSAGGGTANAGTLVQLTPNGNGMWTLTILHTFGSGTDGADPRAGVTIRGNVLYGTTTSGGTESTCGAFGDTPCGTVYQMVPITATHWVERVIYNFTGQSDGSAPLGGVIFDAAGYLYGTTSQGGSGGGAVYRLAPGSSPLGGWQEETLHAFTGGGDGGYSYSKLAFDSAGNMYGTTSAGGSSGLGTVFQLQPAGGGWTFGTLHSFTDTPDAAVPEAGVLVQGNTLYGTSYNGGTSLTCGPFGDTPCGTVYQLVNNDGTWTESVTYSFTGAPDAAQPSADLYADQTGNLYGTGLYGGTAQYGAVFKVVP